MAFQKVNVLVGTNSYLLFELCIQKELLNLAIFNKCLSYVPLKAFFGHKIRKYQ